MIEYKNGSLFNSKLLTLAQGVNCQGKMGAGIALQFRNLFPDMYYAYRVLCKNGNIKPGNAMFYKTKTKLIANLATQNNTGSDARIHWVEDAIKSAVDHLTEQDIHEMALPQIGCGIGGLEWIDVEAILNRYYDFKFEVWIYDK